MKRKGNRVLLLGVALAVVLSSCAAPVEQTPAPQENESTTTTTTTAATTTTTTESTTTTTTATTTEATTTKSATTKAPTTIKTTKNTTKPTTSKTTEKTTKPTTTKATKATTVKTTRTKKPSTTGKPTTVNTKPTTTTLSAQELVDQLFSLPMGASREGVTLKGRVIYVQSCDYINNQATFTLKVEGTTDSHEIYCYQVTPAAGTALVVSPGDPLILSGTVRNNNGTIEFHPAEYTNTLNSHGYTTRLKSK